MNIELDLDDILLLARAMQGEEQRLRIVAVSLEKQRIAQPNRMTAQPPVAAIARVVKIRAKLAAIIEGLQEPTP